MRLLAVILFAAACGSSPAAPDGGGGHIDGTTTGSDGGNKIYMDAPAMTNPNLTVFTIILENHDYNEIVGSANAPYFNSLIAQGALATKYKDTNHPSLPNYLHMISGADQYPGFIDIDPTQVPYFPADQPNLGTQLEAAAIPWRSYQEATTSPCSLTTPATTRRSTTRSCTSRSADGREQPVRDHERRLLDASPPISPRTRIATCGSRRTSSTMATIRRPIRSARSTASDNG